MKELKVPVCAYVCIIINYIALIGLNLSFYILMGESKSPNPLVVSLGLLLVTYFTGYIRPDLWKFVHTKFNKLDEREVQILLRALRTGYSIFAIIVVLLLYLFYFLNEPLNVVFIASLIYLAHVLPASVVSLTYKKNPVH